MFFSTSPSPHPFPTQTFHLSANFSSVLFSTSLLRCWLQTQPCHSGKAVPWRDPVPRAHSLAHLAFSPHSPYLSDCLAPAICFSMCRGTGIRMFLCVSALWRGDPWLSLPVLQPSRAVFRRLTQAHSWPRKPFLPLAANLPTGSKQASLLGWLADF